MRVNALTEDYDTTSKDRQKDDFEDQLNLVCNPRVPPETNIFEEMTVARVIRCTSKIGWLVSGQG